MVVVGRYDAALGRLEQATSVDPRHGEAHFWLAEIWLAKKDAEQASEHHKLARRYLAGRVGWPERLGEQGARVDLVAP